MKPTIFSDLEFAMSYLMPRFDQTVKGEAPPTPLYMVFKDNSYWVYRMRYPLFYRPDIITASVSERLGIPEYAVASFIVSPDELPENIQKALQLSRPLPHQVAFVALTYHSQASSLTTIAAIVPCEDHGYHYVSVGHALCDHPHVLQREFFSQRYGERPEGLEVDYVEDLVAMLSKDITPSIDADKRSLN